ncbi:MAG: DUF2807 domain-containing protein [Melioribacteraceae bacterium]|nr:DUF2807 domain-containing protein [Melioribacteraceae bacterium]MCF8352859.1 DUF2807 domain-containing protein [Melioribacteraceae bacterium]MCF8393824.1 DUF2807 domain-containing protein [Melioribacteraceae bacterium]MCF8417376.1 DUF2807 domain-containing protein [Melioribacteraceae bacterium]
MKRNMFLIVILVFVSLTGCRGFGIKGNGDLKEETRSISEFTDLEVSGAFTVKVIVGESVSLKVRAEENLLKYIRTEVRGDRLEIYSERNISPKHDMEIFLTVTSLENVEASGANNVKIKNVETGDFTIDLSGACNLDVAGKCDYLKVGISGATNLDAKELIAKEVKISASGASNADVYASEKLDADVSGVGNIDFYGDPDDVRSDVSGISSIERK